MTLGQDVCLQYLSKALRHLPIFCRPSLILIIFFFTVVLEDDYHDRQTVKKTNHLVSQEERELCRLCPDSVGAEAVRLRLAFLHLRRQILRDIFRQYYYLLN